MKPFLRVQKLLEGRAYVTGSLIIPHICDLLEGLNTSLVDLKIPTPGDSRDKAAARTAVVSCVEVLTNDFNNRWGSGKIVLTFRKEKRRQPQRFRPEQLSSILYGIEDDEHEKHWTMTSRRAVEIVVAKQTAQADATVSITVSGVRRTAHVASSSASKRPRTGFMVAFMTHAGKPFSAPSPPHSRMLRSRAQ